MDGRFKAKLVSGDDYLLRLSRYVHQNPAWVSGWGRRPLAERIAHLHAYAWETERQQTAKLTLKEGPSKPAG